MFSIQSLWTAAHENIAVTFVIFNNRSYRILKQRTLALASHAASTGKLVGMDLNDPPIDFVALAKSIGVAAVQVDTLDRFQSEFLRSLDSATPRLIEVLIEREV